MFKVLIRFTNIKGTSTENSFENLPSGNSALTTRLFYYFVSTVVVKFCRMECGRGIVNESGEREKTAAA
jgi:hypothetical protein